MEQNGALRLDFEMMLRMKYIMCVKPIGMVTNRQKVYNIHDVTS